MTSVKEFRVEREPTPDSLGRGSFVFTDDYSVFDWGKMPDEIADKGASLCTMGAFNFELLENEGIPTHYRGVVSDGEVVPLADATAPPTEMVIDLTQVPNLPREGRNYDYDLFHSGADENYLIPLEIVFRNSVPVGSSLRRRSDPADHGLDFPEWPEGAVQLEEPVVEFSTKYEEEDRYLSRREADKIAGKASIESLENLAHEVNDIITRQAAEADLVHEDGKIECLYYDGEIRVGDVVGTFDENRFTFYSQQVSKEFIRQYHKREQAEWVDSVYDAKERAKERDVADWKSLCGADPQPLPDDVLASARDLYAAGANAYVGREFFDAPELEDAVMAIKNL
ncbi:phosphoribosylaminoimidazolesuccinocarboxamide synthase [Haladaptatus pallidirubidus]|uniref:phosphoribosylaminoimidazolesuccinocarboxamide synthase n=1 Tax=Haladaptatus pallidirubidus TaxID=1008152 RepID=A0AAV3UF47_9EURY|nr:phosphoribosylaminoimidazolesuccinocarboxamide synthase [Haladaptatus pallidirubidus]